MKTKTIPRAQYNKAKKGYPQKEIVKVGPAKVRVRPEEAEQRRMEHIVTKSAR